MPTTQLSTNAETVFRNGYTIALDRLNVSDQLVVKSLLFILASRLTHNWSVTTPDKASVWIVEAAESDRPGFAASLRSHNIALLRMGNKDTADLNWDIAKPIASKNFIDVFNALSESAIVHAQIPLLGFLSNLGKKPITIEDASDDTNTAWRLKRWPSRTATMPHRARIAAFLLQHVGTRQEIADQCDLDLSDVAEFFNALSKNKEDSLLQAKEPTLVSNVAHSARPASQWIGALRQRLRI